MAEIQRYRSDVYGLLSKYPSGRAVLYADHLADKKAALAGKDRYIGVLQAEVESQLAKHEAENTRQHDNWRRMLEDLKSDHTAALAAKDAELLGDLNRREIAHGKELTTALAAQAAKHSAELLHLRQFKDSELAAQAEEHKAELHAHRTDYEEKIATDLQNYMDSLRAHKSQHAKELAEARGEGEPVLIKHYRKKPIEVEVIQFDAANGYFIEEWSKGAVVYSPKYGWLKIATPEGVMTAIVGDWIIKGVQGEFYPCKPGIFEETYDDA